MSTSFLAMLAGILVSLFFKKKKWRFKVHKRLGIYAGVSGLTALILAATMVQIYNGVHFTSLHAVLGAFTGLLLMLTPLAGLRILRSRQAHRQKILHKLAGYTTVVMMGITVFSGMVFMGIIGL